jgi:hypothetical protein
MNLHAIGLFITNQSGNGGAGGGPLTAIVRDSDGNTFTVTNQVYNSVTNSFIVSADVKNLSAVDFTVFT